ncbi:hypothetical protein FNV43_RR16871 [Rhamnella rubrinervis]|uniref:Uncharacterized protein n=1 Tax=Rhamnella rubrinervis TaxID=2594499 RepID=A0A8K0GZQ7_9ROSA|nr:hypothetical protein FNV43_RR16871 [Rhamnella rubrinervis]
MARISPLIVSVASLENLKTSELKKYVKSKLPGGFDAQMIIGTDHQKSTIASIDVQEGNKKVIINYCDAKM